MGRWKEGRGVGIAYEDEGPGDGVILGEEVIGEETEN